MLGQLEVPFEIDAHTYPFGAIVIECLTYEAILGRDFLECYDAKKDLGQQLLHLEHGSAIICWMVSEISLKSLQKGPRFARSMPKPLLSSRRCQKFSYLLL